MNQERITTFSENEKRQSSQEKLPILEYKKEIKELLKTTETAIIIGETGSGKTTELPLFLLEKLEKGEKIAMTQPRRVAARSVSKFVAGKVGCKIGEEIGFNVRFDDQTSEGTRLTFMTDGILLRKIQIDPLLSEYATVVVDEAHERSLNIDFLLGLLKELQVKRKENSNPLQIVVTSATLEKEKFTEYFNQAPTIEVPGRLHPVDIHFEESTPRNVTGTAAEKVKEIASREELGDVLIFMPGRQEIEDTIKKIKESGIQNIETLSLFGEMSPEDQDKVFNKSEKRKVIVATNIAETSLTIPGLKYVIDSGLIRQVEFDQKTGIEALVTRYHSKAGAKQRAGRAGRMEAGECYRLYSEADFEEKFQEHQTPEIQRSNLAQVVLMMKKIGIEKVEEFDFVDPPEREAFASAITTLKNLGALDEEGKLTKIGEVIADLPLEPHLGRMILEAKNYKCVNEIVTIAAFLNGRSVFARPSQKESEADNAHAQFKNQESDFMSLLNVWNAYAQSGFKDSWAHKNFLNPKVLAEVGNIKNQLLKALKQNNIQATSLLDAEAIGKSLTAGLIENLFEHSHKWYYNGVVKKSNSGVAVFPGSSTRGNIFPWFVTEDVYTNPKGATYARTIQKVKPEWIIEVAPQLIDKAARGMTYDENTNSVANEMEYYLKATRTTLENRNEPAEGEEAEKFFAKYLATHETVLEFQAENKEVIKQLDILFKKSMGKIQSIDLKTEYQKILAGHKVYGIDKLNELMNSSELDLKLTLDSYVDSESVKNISEKNPDYITINGNEYRLTYEYLGYYEFDKINPEKFIAKACIPVDALFDMQTIPQLPSGRNLNIVVVSDLNSTYAQFSGTEIEALKLKAQEYVVNRQWSEWKNKNNLLMQRIESHDFSTGELPNLPESIVFGADPVTKENLIAYAGVVRDVYYNRFSIQYFKTQKEAQLNTEQVQEYANKKLEEKKIEQEREQLIVPLKARISEVKSLWEGVMNKHTHLELGMSYGEYSNITSAIKSAEGCVDRNPSQAKEYIDLVVPKIEKAMEYKDSKEKTVKLVDEAMGKYYGNIKEIRRELVDFPMDEDGEDEEFVVLSRLLTDTNKIIAEHIYGGSNSQSYIEKPDRYNENGWQGEPFDTVVFEDYGRILTSATAGERANERESLKHKLGEKKRFERYEEDLEYAEDQLENGYWKEGSFKKVNNPKSGVVQWEMSFGRKGNKVTYIVDGQSFQPQNEQSDYFFSVQHTLVDLTGNKVMLVHIERPYPEDAPNHEEDENSKESGEDMSKMLEALKNKFS